MLKPAVGLGQLEVGLRLVQIGLVSLRINLKQLLPFVNLVAFFERCLGHVAGNAGPDVGCLKRIQSTGEFLEVHDLAGHGLGDFDID